jgi:hypothetical protein
MLGPWLLPLGAFATVLVADVVRAAMALRADDGSGSRRPSHHTVLGWGLLAAVVGLLGTVLGLARLVTGARVVAGGDRAELEGVLDVLRDGAVVAVTPAAAGLGLFTAAVAAWLALQYASGWRMR